MAVLAQSNVSTFVDGVEEGLTAAWTDVVAFAPRIIGAAVILLVGWLVAKMIRTAVTRIFTGVGVDKLLDRAGLSATLKDNGHTASSVMASIIYWMALLTVFLMAAEAMQIATLSVLLASLIAYLPLVIVAVVIIIVAAALGRFVGEMVAPWAERQQVKWVATGAQVAIVFTGVIAALNTLNVAEDIVNALFYAVVGSTSVAFAIAFGVGGIKTGETIWRRVVVRASDLDLVELDA